MSSNLSDSNHSGKSNRTNEGKAEKQKHVINKQSLDEKTLPESEVRIRATLLESEQRFRFVFEHSPLGMSITGIDGSLQVNQAFCAMLGYSHEELVNKNWRYISHNDDEQFTDSITSDLLSGKLDKATFEKRYIHKNCEIVYAEVSTFLQRDAELNPLYFITSVKNITRRKKAEQEQFRLLNIIENSLNEIYIFDAETFKFEHLNKGALENLGYTSEEIKSLTPYDIKPEYTEDSFRKAVEPLLSGLEKKLVFETFHRRKNGTLYPVEVHLQLDHQGERPLFLAIINDITKRAQSDKQLNLSEYQYRTLFEQASDGIFITDREGNYLDVNTAGCKMVGYSREEILKMNIKDLVGEEGITANPIKYKELKEQPQVLAERQLTCKDGSVIHVEISGKMLKDGRLQGVVRDITKRKRTEEQLRESEERYSAFINADIDMIFVKDEHRRYLMANNAMAAFFGKTPVELIGKTDEELTDQMKIIPCKSSDKKALEASEAFTVEEQLGDRIYETTKFPLHLRGSKKGIGGIIRDITERKQAEAVILEVNQKMDAFFNQSLDGFFFMMLDEPINWNEEANKEKLLDHAFSHQKITKINQAMLDQYEAAETDFMNLTPADFFAHNVAHGKDQWRKLYNDGKLHTITDERKLNGEPIVIEGDYICLYDAEGRITGHFGIQRDITQIKLAEIEIKESEKKFRTLVESSPDGISLLDLEGNILFANQHKAEMIGVNLFTDLIGINAYSLIAPKYHEMFWSLSDEFFAAGQLKNIESEVVRRDGSTFWAEFNLSLVTDADGVPAYIMDSMRDISERKKAEEKILQSEKELKRAQQVAHVGNWIWNIKTNKLIWSDEMYRIFGIDKSTFTGDLNEVIHLRIHPDDQEKVFKSNASVVKESKPISLEYRVIWEDGSIRVVWAEAGDIEFDQNGKPSLLHGIVQDITDRKKAEAQISKLNKSIEQSPSTIVITDLDGSIEYVNPKFTEITGYSAEEVIGKNPRILKSGKMPDEVYRQVWQTLQSGDVWRGEFLNQKKNGDLYWEWATMTSIKNDKGEIINYIAIKEDISLRKQMEADLIAAKERAEESDRLKSAFLANMSHEIRTPLNSIIGFSELLGDEAYDAEMKNTFVSHIVTNGNNLLTIISDIVDISKIESGEITIRTSSFKVAQLLDDLTIMHEINAKEKQLSLKCICACKSSNEPVVVSADKERLFQVFNNLIGNALKFTAQGYIEIGCRQSDRMIEFYVKDTGIGIPADYHEKIFDRFRQVEASYTRKYGGNGLGLAISKKLIELMGGKIWVESEVGKGSTFYFTLPKQ